MSKVITPTVSRKVWYRPSKADLMGPLPMSIAGSLESDEDPQPLDATILAVWGDRCLNIKVRDVYGRSFTKCSVVLLQPGDEPPRDADGKIIGGYAYWMPYQQGQAAKAEQAQAGTDDKAESARVA
ncbi:MAG: hypothetical protein QM762_08830 [Chryseolinea sp.]